MEASKEFKIEWRKLRNAIKVPEKDAKNPHFKSSYRSWEATEAALQKAGIDSHFVTINNDNQAGVEWWVEISGEEVKVNTCLVDKAKRDPQATGGCFSYALRYCVATYLGWGMPDLDDDGNNATGIEVDTSFDPVKLDAEIAAEKTRQANQAAANTDSSGVTIQQEADLLAGVFNMQVTGAGLLEAWTNHGDQINRIMQHDAQLYEKVVQAYQKKGHEIKTKELENGSAK